MKKIIVSKKAKELLRKTIDEKWKLVRAGETTERGPQNCYLCHEFNSGRCENCPIFKKTELRYCNGTPYQAWCKHQKDIHIGLSPHKIYCPTCKRIATQEINFLEALYEECEVRTK